MANCRVITALFAGKQKLRYIYILHSERVRAGFENFKTVICYRENKIETKQRKSGKWEMYVRWSTYHWKWKQKPMQRNCFYHHIYIGDVSCFSTFSYLSLTSYSNANASIQKNWTTEWPKQCHKQFAHYMIWLVFFSFLFLFKLIAL